MYNSLIEIFEDYRTGMLTKDEFIHAAAYFSGRKDMASAFAPVYVLQQFMDGETFYFSHNTEKFWTTDPLQSVVFTQLKAAARVADLEKAYVRVLYTPEMARQFGWEDEINLH
jgi:hypothetical protein